MDCDLLDAFTGGHLHGIKVQGSEDRIYIELETSFWIYSSLQSSGMQSYCLNPQIHKVNSEVFINGWVPLDWILL